MCVFHLHLVTPFSLKSDDLKFVQNYFEVGSVLWARKIEIDNDVTMTSSLL